jgi:hypothetical protein
MTSEQAQSAVLEKYPDAECRMVSRITQVRYRVYANGRDLGVSQKSESAAWQSAAIDLQLFGVKK